MLSQLRLFEPLLFACLGRLRHAPKLSNGEIENPLRFCSIPVFLHYGKQSSRVHGVGLTRGANRNSRHRNTLRVLPRRGRKLVRPGRLEPEKWRKTLRCTPPHLSLPSSRQSTQRLGEERTVGGTAK